MYFMPQMTLNLPTSSLFLFSVIRIRIQDRHESFHDRRLRHFLETVFPVKVMGVLGPEEPHAQAVKPGVVNDGLDKPFAQPPASVRPDYKDIAYVSGSGVVSDDPGKAHLPALMIYAETQRILDGS